MPLDLSRLPSLLRYDAAAPLLFNSGLFLWLFAGFALVYALLQRRTTARLLFVTLFSYYFYYKSSGTYFFLLAVVSASDFLIARALGRTADAPRTRRLLVAASLTLNLGLLAYFKYTNFLGTAFAALLGGSFQPQDIFLPVGISFFTFQSLSYTIDVYRRQISPLSNPLDYFFYVSFFPQLVAGPIVRARDFIPQIRRPLALSRTMTGEAVALIAGGLIKKAVISDYISTNFVDRVFDNPLLYSGLENLAAVYGYALQIYCDFSGYSDMAIGIALLLGFRFPDNFRSPYKSRSVTEFWRRWHISLSSWLRDYLYISLGGNRRGKVRQYVNLVATMLLGGLWHGASWNFVAWGGMHGVALAVHKKWMELTRQPRGGTRLHGWRAVVAALLTFHFVCLAWVFFRSASFETAGHVLSQIFTNFQGRLLPQLLTGYAPAMALIAVGYALHLTPHRWAHRLQARAATLPLPLQALLLVIAAWAVIQVKGSDVQPFIYFQF
ncbi:MAG: MBOAT family protein [Bacteroidaceae bacterium]|nr:MBOAT family protein [Bacteroidaceae bacterium]